MLHHASQAKLTSMADDQNLRRRVEQLCSRQAGVLALARVVPENSFRLGARRRGVFQHGVRPE